MYLESITRFDKCHWLFLLVFHASRRSSLTSHLISTRFIVIFSALTLIILHNLFNFDIKWQFCTMSTVNLNVVFFSFYHKNKTDHRVHFGLENLEGWVPGWPNISPLAWFYTTLCEAGPGIWLIQEPYKTTVCDMFWLLWLKSPWTLYSCLYPCIVLCRSTSLSWIVYFYYKRKKKGSDSVLWQKPLHPQKAHKKHRDNTKTPPQKIDDITTIADRHRKVKLTNATQLLWLNRFTGSQSSHQPQKPFRTRIIDLLNNCSQKYAVSLILIIHLHICWMNVYYSKVVLWCACENEIS